LTDFQPNLPTPYPVAGWQSNHFAPCEIVDEIWAILILAGSTPAGRIFTAGKIEQEFGDRREESKCGWRKISRCRP
jgi:hypothetical protein